jgi:hypothetical protein
MILLGVLMLIFWLAGVHSAAELRNPIPSQGRRCLPIFLRSGSRLVCPAREIDTRQPDSRERVDDVRRGPCRMRQRSVSASSPCLFVADKDFVAGLSGISRKTGTRRSWPRPRAAGVNTDGREVNKAICVTNVLARSRERNDLRTKLSGS